MPPRPRTFRPWKLAVSCAALVVASALAEGALRVVGFEHPPEEPPPITMWTPVEDGKMDQGRYLHVWDTDSVWAPSPGAFIPRHIIPEGAGEHVNAAGFRGPELPHERAPAGGPRPLRVATLGDSSTFGLGVLWADTFSAQLVRELEPLVGPVEVLDAGVVGFTAVQGVGRFTTRVAPYRPDVVVIAFGSINEHFAMAASDVDKLARLRREQSRVQRLARAARRELRLLHLADRALELVAPGPAEPASAPPSEVGPAHPDFSGTRRVTLDEYEAALRELVARVEAAGAVPVLLSMPRRPSLEERMPALLGYTRRLEELARATGRPFVDGHALFRSAAAPGSDGDPYFLPGDGVHPSPEGHALLARALGERIAELAAAPTGAR